jgi:signal transduction histidine kinase
MNVHLKILSLEDVEDDVGLIERLLYRNNISFELKRVDSRADFVGALRHFRPDVILSDHSLPQFNSVEALKICKRLHSSAPFILVTGAVSEEFAVTCLKEGADDYVLKSNLARLPSAIQNALKQREAEAQQRRVEQELRIQNDELAKVNKEMDSFIYSVSHNIRSPLASVLGLLDLAVRDDQARDRFFSEYFSMMNRSIKKLDDTLREILDYSRNARSEIQVEEIDVRQVIGLNLEQLKYLSGFENMQVQIKVVQDEAFYADKARLSVILCNLISNSIKYRDPNKTENRLSISFLLANRTAELSVEDNGIGIAEEVLPNVFNMFFRGTEKSDGAGLGLYIVKESVSKLKGEVTIESRVGHGTVCRIVMRQATWVGRELPATGGRSIHAE